MNNLNPIFQQALAPFVNPLRFKATYCSQCGGEFGPGPHGYSHCSEHKAQSWHQANDAAAFKTQLQQQDKGV